MDHPIKRPTYEEHIQNLFTPGDAGCMSNAIDLTTYEGVRADASKISDWIGSGRMPPPETGRQWSREKLRTFRNWGNNTGFAERRMTRLVKSGTPRVRKSIHDYNEGSEDLEQLKKAFTGIIERDNDLNDPTSFFNMAGIHWLPGPRSYTYCRHHDDAYNPWHRAYLIAFEDALRTVDGCEAVTLPYWDILGEKLPAWVYEKPFYPYPLPYKLTNLNETRTFDIGYATQRFDADRIALEVTRRKDDIADKIGEALAAKTWKKFNGWSEWPKQHEGIIRAHDAGHGICGATIGNQDVAAFDPLFWFFHCNWDRLWWQWQTDNSAQTLSAFKELVSGDDYWLEEEPDTLLPPFDVNSAEMINLADWDVDYEQPAPRPFDINERLIFASGGVRAEKSIRVPTTKQFSVRVKNINRLNIPGSFDIALYVGPKAVKRTSIFQPSTPQDCDTCKKHGIFNADFIVDETDLVVDVPIRVAIEITDEAGIRKELPLHQVGNPTLNIRLLLESD